MEQLVAYVNALELEKNEKMNLAAKAQEIISQNDRFETEIPGNLNMKMREIETVTENMITEVKPINESRLDFGKVFSDGTGSHVFLLPTGKHPDGHHSHKLFEL